MSADAPEDDEGATLEPAAPEESVSESAAPDAAASVDGAPEQAASDAAREAPDAPSSSGVPRCAEHPERAAYAICERCGDNLCSDCRRASGGADRCAACVAREGGESSVIPWEDPSGSFPWRIFGSLDGLVLRPSRVMARLPSGRRGMAFQFLFLVVAFAGIGNTVLSGQIVSGVGAGMVAALFTCLCAWLGGLAAAGVASFAGASASAEQIGRAGAYAWSAHCIGALTVGVGSLFVRIFLESPDPLASAVPVVGGLAITVVLAARSMFAFARGRLRLGMGGSLAVSAAVVAPIWLPTILCGAYIYSFWMKFNLG